MRNIFLAKITIFIALTVACCTKVLCQASGFVGEDQHILRENETEIIKLGVKSDFDYDEYVFYKWEIVDHPDDDAGMLSNTDQAQTELTVTAEGTYVCKCFRVSKYGFQTEYVTIDICDEIVIKSIESNKECFATGTALDVSDFDIVTDPPGYEEIVELMPGSEVAKRSTGFGNPFTVGVGMSGFSYGAQSDEPVYFHVRRKDDTYYVPDNNMAKIVVVDASVISYGTNVPIGKTGFDRVSLLAKKVNHFRKKLSNSDWLKELKALRDPASLSLDFNLSPGASYDCCDDNVLRPILSLDASLALTAALHSYIQLPIPFTGFDITLASSGAFNLTAGRFNIAPNKPLDDVCDNGASLKFTLQTTLTAKVMVTLVPGSDVVSAGGGLQGYVKIDFIILPTSEQKKVWECGVNGFVEVIAVVTLYSGNITICEPISTTL